MTLRSPYDREIRGLALPALGALAAEPLYLLADTAMVGHLGTEELAALAIAGTLIVGAFTLFNFLTYGTTAQVARVPSGVAPGRIASRSVPSWHVDPSVVESVGTQGTVHSSGRSCTVCATTSSLSVIRTRIEPRSSPV